MTLDQAVKLCETRAKEAKEWIKAGGCKGDIGVEHEHEAYIIDQQQFALLLKDARQYLMEAVDGFRAFGKELDEKCELNLDCSKCQLNNGGNCRSWKHAKAVMKLIEGKQ